ncbi:hypothetical protein ROZALSC1DRAFT_22894, partial [Rozella allomycis CSF55]
QIRASVSDKDLDMYEKWNQDYGSWDIIEKKKKRVLIGAASVGIHHAIFSPSGDKVVTMFKDNEIAVWSFETFYCLYKISIDVGIEAFPSDQESIDVDITLPISQSKFQLMQQPLCFSSDGTLLVIVSIVDSSLFVWKWNEQSLHQQIDIPLFKEANGFNTPIKQAKFIGNTKLIGIVSSIGLFIIVDAETGKLVYKMPKTVLFDFVEFSKDGKFLSGVPSEDPKTIKLMNLKDFIKKKLLNYLRNFGEFPEKYRILIWRFLLRLPENRQPFQSLCDKGLHPAFEKINRKYPIKSYQMIKTLERVLSCLGHWSPLFAECDYFPSFVFPFIYAWPILQTFFASHFSSDEWAVLMDHIISEDPSFIYYLTVAYIRYHRETFLNMKTIQEFNKFHEQSIPTNVKMLLKSAKKIQTSTPTEIDIPKDIIEPFKPIPRSPSAYPLFSNYPVKIVHFQKKVRDKIRREELDFLQRKKVLHELSQLHQDIETDERKWIDYDNKVSTMMDEFWDKLIKDENDHQEKVSKINALETEQRTKLLKNIQKVRQNLVHQSDAFLNKQKDWEFKLDTARASLRETKIVGHEELQKLIDEENEILK